VNTGNLEVRRRLTRKLSTLPSKCKLRCERLLLLVLSTTSYCLYAFPFDLSIVCPLYFAIASCLSGIALLTFAKYPKVIFFLSSHHSSPRKKSLPSVSYLYIYTVNKSPSNSKRQKDRNQPRIHSHSTHLNTRSNDFGNSLRV